LLKLERQIGVIVSTPPARQTSHSPSSIQRRAWAIAQLALAQAAASVARGPVSDNRSAAASTSDGESVRPS